MSCIITYKGQKYSEEQFKEYFINNKQEFATSIAKNKDVIDSFKRKMEGIDFVFSQSPELASIGSKAQYLQYLSTIFKTSKVKDIVYHGTNTEFEQFKSISPNFDTLNSIEGIYNFSTNKEFVKRYGNRIVKAILNIRKPIKDTTSGEFIDDMDRPLSEALFKIGKQKSKNILAPKYDESLKDVDGVINSITGEEYVAKHPISGKEIGLPKQNVITVFEPEQIHILGSKQDIEGFKEYISSNKNEFSHIIASNKNVIDSFKRKMEGIDYVFSQSPELASIGSKIQYLQYLSTIFKTSKVKDIVYHGSKSDKKFDKFVKGLYREVTLPGNITKTVPESSRVGIWFSDKNYASDPANTPTGVVIPAILNIKNPAYADDISYGPIKKYQDTNDAVIGKDDVNKETDSIAVFDPEQIHILGSKQDIEGFKKFTSDKIGIKSVGTNDNLTYQFIAVNKILDNIDKVKRWDKQIKDRNAFWNKIQQDLKIPKSQIDLLKEVNGRTIEEKLASFVAEYGYVIEIKTVIGKENTGYKYDYETGEYYTGEKAGENTQYYSNLTVPGGINYIENEIATPNIIPSIKGHAQFASDLGIGWTRTDEKVQYTEKDIDSLIDILKKSGQLEINCK